MANNLICWIRYTPCQANGSYQLTYLASQYAVELVTAFMGESLGSLRDEVISQGVKASLKLV
jgi:hypothetical protein